MIFWNFLVKFCSHSYVLRTPKNIWGSHFRCFASWNHYQRFTIYNTKTTSHFCTLILHCCSFLPLMFVFTNKFVEKSVMMMIHVHSWIPSEKRGSHALRFASHTRNIYPKHVQCIFTPAEPSFASTWWCFRAFFVGFFHVSQIFFVTFYIFSQIFVCGFHRTWFEISSCIIT